MSEALNGKYLNVTTKKGVEKVLIVRELKTKGIVRAEDGSEYPIASITKKGRGLFIDMTAKAGAKPSAKTPAAENTRKAAPAERTASAVTAEELEGKKVDGVEVARVLKSKGTVKLEDGKVIAIASIRRKGRGYVSDAESAPAPKSAPVKTGGVKPKTRAPKETAKVELTSKDVRDREIEVDGDIQTITNTYTSGMVKTDAGIKFPLADIEQDGEDLIYQSPEFKEALQEAARAAEKKASAKPERVAAPVTAKELKGKKIAVGDVTHEVTKTFSKTGNVETDRGLKISITDIVRKGRGYLFKGELPKKTGGALPKNRTAPAPEPTVKQVPAFTADVAADIRDLIKDAVVKALVETYDIDVAAVFGAVSPEVFTLSISLSATDADEIRVKRSVDALRKANFADASEVEQEEEEEEGRDFDETELTGSDDDIPEDEEEEENEEEEETDEEEEENEEEEQDEEEEENEEEEEPEFDEEEEEEFENETAETSFPEDTSELTLSATARLSKLLPGRNLASYVEKWYESQEVFDTIGYDLEPGMTVEIDGINYVLIGLSKDKAPTLLNPTTMKARAGVDLEKLAELA